MNVIIEQVSVIDGYPRASAPASSGTQWYRRHPTDAVPREGEQLEITPDHWTFVSLVRWHLGGEVYVHLRPFFVAGHNAEGIAEELEAAHWTRSLP